LSGSLPTEMTPCQAPKLVVDEGHQVLERRLVSTGPRSQQRGHFRRPRLRISQGCSRV
jgi:hypothetical protein